MSRKSAIVLGAVWSAIDAALALAGYEDVDVIRGSRRPKGVSSPSVTVFWFTEMRRDSNYRVDDLVLQVVIWEDNNDDQGLTETAIGISAIIDEALNGNTIGVESPEGSGTHYGTWALSRDGVPLPEPEGFDTQSNEYYRALRYMAIVG